MPEQLPATDRVDQLLDVAEAAARLGTGVRFVRRLIAERWIRYVHIGRHVRIPLSAIEEFIAQGTVEPLASAAAQGPVPRVQRKFGSVRRLPSGRHQASYLAADGRRRNADATFESSAEALQWLATVRTLIHPGQAVDPDPGKLELASYASSWIEQRAALRPRTRESYRYLYARYLEAQVGSVDLHRLDAAAVRAWRGDLAAAGVSDSMIAKAYRLLHAVLATAVDDGVLARNPCRIRGAGQEHPAERPTLTMSQVFQLAAAVPARFEAMVLVTTFASLRWGEVSALRRRDLDLERGAVTVAQAFVEVRGSAPVSSPPKSRAGSRTVAVPREVVERLRHHLEEYTGPDPDDRVFVGPKGAVLRRGNFNSMIRWKTNVADVDAVGLHFHDLRHTGNMLAASVPGVSTKDLMQRMGHDSIRAAHLPARSCGGGLAGRRRTKHTNT